MLSKFEWIVSRYEELSEAIVQPEVIADTAKYQACLKERAALEPQIEAWQRYQRLLTDITQAQEMLADPDLADMAREELDSLLPRKAGKLSGGWQRKVSIAMALISQPQILFLDEPTLGLDVIARHDLWEAIRTLKGRITIILTTHYMEEAEALSDRIGIMKEGHLLAVGTGAELKAAAGTDDFETAFVSIVKEGRV